MELSPDYLIEKFKRYINDDISIINNEEAKGGVHHALMRDLVEPYMEKWKIKINRNDALQDILF
jgi:hypothetical protein